MRISKPSSILPTSAGTTVAAALMLLFGAGTASASVLTFGCVDASSCTLEELFNGGSIIVNDKTFTNWTLTGLDLNSTSDHVDLDEIAVSGLDDGGFDPGPGLSFDSLADIEAVGDDQVVGFISFEFGFDVNVSNSNKIKDNTLSLDTTYFSGTGGHVNIEELVYDSAGVRIGRKYVYEDNLAQFGILFDEANFAPQDQIHVDLKIGAFTDYLDEIAAIDAFTLRFSQVPEPATLALLGLGLAGIGAARRKKLVA